MAGVYVTSIAGIKDSNNPHHRQGRREKSHGCAHPTPPGFSGARKDQIGPPAWRW